MANLLNNLVGTILLWSQLLIAMACIVTAQIELDAVSHCKINFLAFLVSLYLLAVLGLTHYSAGLYLDLMHLLRTINGGLTVQLGLTGGVGGDLAPVE